MQPNILCALEELESDHDETNIHQLINFDAINARHESMKNRNVGIHVSGKMRDISANSNVNEQLLP